jgi:hypothetical protein
MTIVKYFFKKLVHNQMIIYTKSVFQNKICTQLIK